MAIGAVAGAITMAIFGFGIYGIVSCGTREYWKRRVQDAKDDEKYESFVAQVVGIERDKDFTHVRLSSKKKDYDATVIPETNKFFEKNSFELKLGESYTFTVFASGEPVINKPIAAVASEDGKTVYLSYEDGKQFIIDYFVSKQK